MTIGRLLLLVSLTQAPQMVLPDGPGTWTVRVVTSGGLLGTGSGDFVVSSEGKVLCSREIRCPKDFSAASFQPLIEAIPAVVPPQPSSPAVTLCSDCITRTVTITHRDPMGIVHTHSASWNETTRTQ